MSTENGVHEPSDTETWKGHPRLMAQKEETLTEGPSCSGTVLGILHKLSHLMLKIKLFLHPAGRGRI